MNKFIKFFIIFFIQIFVAIIIVFFVVLYILNKTITPTYIQQNNLINIECQEHILTEINQILFNVSNHEYIKYKYDCTEFSSELVKQLNNSNLSAYCVFGYFIENQSIYHLHTWVELNLNGEILPLEATGGYIIDNLTYNTYYRSLKKGFCV